jgi:hypothetical protein
MAAATNHRVSQFTRETEAMILRRITARFRRQDWTAVVVERVIVVPGVFIGPQAQEWATVPRIRTCRASGTGMGGWRHG